MNGKLRYTQVNSVDKQFIHMENVNLSFTTYLYSLGEVKVIINGNQIKLSSGDSILIKEGEVISIFIDDFNNLLSISDSLKYIHISTKHISMFNKFKLSLHEDVNVKSYISKGLNAISNVVYRSGCLTSTEQEKIEFIIHIMGKEDICKESSLLEHPFLSSSLLNILCTKVNDTQEILNASYKSQLSESVAELVIKDYSINWTVGMLSKHFNTSASAFKKRMSKEVGCTSIFIREIKMTEALRLLKRTNLSISNISCLLGFCNQAYFCSVFKSFFNRTPMAIRKSRQ
ncbi:MAG: helix-turn-helix transcriptional regulator [Paraclostridium sp.]